MTKKTKYIQCELSNGTHWQVAWIPSQYAVINKELRIRVDGEWYGGWVVVQPYKNVVLPEEYIKTHERDYTRQRKFSDRDVHELKYRLPPSFYY